MSRFEIQKIAVAAEGRPRGVAEAGRAAGDAVRILGVEEILERHLGQSRAAADREAWAGRIYLLLYRVRRHA